MSSDVDVVEVLLAIGVSVVGYFLRAVHGDLRIAIKQLHEQETRLAVGSKTFQNLEHRIAVMSEDRERRLLALEEAVFLKKGA